MKIVDSIYGEFNVEQIFIDIINTKAVQRLKGIHQAGADYLINEKYNITRYEHSIGTMLLIRILGGSIEEQMAGLLHDISHTAFSHVVDYALEDTSENYHERIYKEVIEKSDIPRVLRKNGYDYKEIFYNEEKWTILEKSAPKLCADRIDYTLRDMYQYDYINKKEIEYFLGNIEFVHNEIVIKNVKAAEWFVETYYKEVIDFFMDPLNIYANNRLGEALKRALESNEINFDDLLKEDKEVYRLLITSEDKEILDIVNSISSDVNLIEDKEDYDIFQKNKLRLIDPSVLVDGELLSASQVSKKVKTMTKQALEKSKEGVYIKIQ